jgi:hypothetical protein
MKRCRIFHTGIFTSADGILKNNRIYLKGSGNTLFFPEEMFMAIEECEEGLIQFEIEGKWGFADIYTGKIIIEPVWDYAGPFYSGYAHVALGAQLDDYDAYRMQGGKHGYIDKTGKIIIPIEYDDAEEITYRHKYFRVAKNGCWGLVDNQNAIFVPLKWDELEVSYHQDLIFCGKKENIDAADSVLTTLQDKPSEARNGPRIKWGVYDQNFNMMVEPELDDIICPKVKENPKSRSYYFYDHYYIIKRKSKFGVICMDGRWVANIKFSKAQAKALINSISPAKYRGNLYL